MSRCRATGRNEAGPAGHGGESRALTDRQRPPDPGRPDASGGREEGGQEQGGQEGRDAAPAVRPVDAVPKVGAAAYRRPQPLRFDRLGAALNALGTVWIFGLLVLVDADILGRELFGAPVRGAIEIVGLSIVGIVFLQLPNALWAGRFTKAELLIDALGGRKPRLGAAVQGVLHLLGALALALVTVAVWPEFLRAVEIGDYVGAIADFTAPTWPVRLVMVVGSALTAITFLFLAWSDFRTALDGAAAGMEDR